MDHSGYYFNFSVYRRDGTKEAAHETVRRMAAPLPAGSLVVGDSYFGNISTIEALALEGKHGLFSCQSRRPTFLFQNGITPNLQEDGDSSSLYGTLPNVSEGGIRQFMANGFKSKGRNLYTLSTCFSANLEDVHVEMLVDDDTGELFLFLTIESYIVVFFHSLNFIHIHIPFILRGASTNSPSPNRVSLRNTQ